MTEPVPSRVRVTRFLLCGVGLVTAVGIIVHRGGVLSSAPSSVAAMPEGQLQCSHWAVYRSSQLVGLPVTSAQVRKLLPFDQNGHTMLQIAESLRELGLGTEARKESIDTLEDRNCPCIVHLHSPDHFVVVCGVDAEAVHMYDGSGRRIMRSKEAVGKRFSGVVLYVQPSEGDAVDHSTSERVTGARSPNIRFETLLVDKGAIGASGDPVAFIYPFFNSGDDDLIIKDVNADCKCLKAEAPQEPIPPNKDGEIKLFYHIKPRRGPFSHKALVETNDPRNTHIALEAAGYTGTDVSLHPHA